jgi:hypothetical protein
VPNCDAPKEGNWNEIIDSRLRKLEDRFGTRDKPRVLLVIYADGWQHRIDWQIDILERHGHLPTGPLGLICLAGIPGGMDVAKKQMYLGENGAEFQGLGSLIRVDSGHHEGAIARVSMDGHKRSE